MSLAQIKEFGFVFLSSASSFRLDVMFLGFKTSFKPRSTNFQNHFELLPCKPSQNTPLTLVLRELNPTCMTIKSRKECYSF